MKATRGDTAYKITFWHGKKFSGYTTKTIPQVHQKLLKGERKKTNPSLILEVSVRANLEKKLSLLNFGLFCKETNLAAFDAPHKCGRGGKLMGSPHSGTSYEGFPAIRLFC
jgi:hypothetical protein